jgi:SAM-dependent methyltransferase
VTFQVAAESYDRFMGRYSTQLSAPFADFAGVREGMTVLDVGCGPGALTGELVARVGEGSVHAVDPSEPFVAAARERHPDVDVRQASAAALPFEDGTFDAALAQLVVHFMRDPVAEIAEIGRVTRSGGVVAACVWDHAGEQSPLGPFWRAMREIDPATQDESSLPGARDGHLVQLFEEAGLQDVAPGLLSVSVSHASFDEWWEPFTLGVGPAGAHFGSLPPGQQEAVRERCRAELGDGPFDLPARTWAARGVVA